MRRGPAFGALLALALAVVTLCLRDVRAQSRDVAGEAPYPMQAGPATKPAAKSAAKPHHAAKPAAPKPAVAAKPVEPATVGAKPAGTETGDIKLPLPRPDVKAESRREAAIPAATPPAKAAPAPVNNDPFARLPANERAAIRSALLWSSAEDGKPGDREDPMTAAIKAYQKRNKAKVTGLLTGAERAELLTAAARHKDDFGWSVMVDPATGVRIGIPGKLAPEARTATNGTRWASRHGDVVIETFRIKTNDSLPALFEAQKKEPAIRKVESSYARADNFFVSGLQGLKLFAVRAQLKGGELRGYTMLYDQAMAGIVLPVLSPMANAFAPFPDGSAPIATLSQPVAYGSGVIVSEIGHIVTDRRVAQDCDVITIPGVGNAERIALDEQHGLALLRVYGRHRLTPATLAPDKAATADFRLVGVPDPNTQNGGGVRSTISAQLGDNNAIRLREPMPLAGFSGAAALDRQGRVLGIMEMRNVQLASAQPAAPPVRLIPADSIRGFLAANQITPAQGGDSAASIVRVICVRH
jgi:S1-C subfamily serine protease